MFLRATREDKPYAAGATQLHCCEATTCEADWRARNDSGTCALNRMQRMHKRCSLLRTAG